MICQGEMVTIFPQCVYFWTIQDNELVLNSMCHCFNFRFSNWCHWKFSPLPNHFNQFHSIWIYIASYIHFLPETNVSDRIFGLVTNPNLNKVYLENYRKPKAEIFLESSSVYYLFPNQILELDPWPKKNVDKIWFGKR